MYLHSTVPVLRIKVFKRCDQFHHWCHGEMALSSLGTFWRLQLFNAANLSSLGKGWAESLKCLASVSQAVASNCNSPVVFVPGNALEPCFFHLHAVTRAATSCPDCLDVVCCQYAFKKIIIKAEDGPQWAWGGNYRHYFVYYRKKSSKTLNRIISMQSLQGKKNSRVKDNEDFITALHHKPYSVG